MKIEKLDIWVQNFDATMKFYEQMLCLPVIDRRNHFATFQVGESCLTLHKDEDCNHYYHFAFNVPSNQFKEAKQWLQQRTALLLEKGNDDVFFSGWMQAYACYFEDPAGNIVEFISRQQVTSFQRETIHPHPIISIGEIGLVTTNVHHIEQQLNKLKLYRHNGESLTENALNFIGEVDGDAFIIVGPVGRRWYFSDKKAVEAPVHVQTDKGFIVV